MDNALSCFFLILDIFVHRYQCFLFIKPLIFYSFKAITDNLLALGEKLQLRTRMVTATLTVTCDSEYDNENDSDSDSDSNSNNDRGNDSDSNSDSDHNSVSE